MCEHVNDTCRSGMYYLSSLFKDRQHILTRHFFPLICLGFISPFCSLCGLYDMYISGCFIKNRFKSAADPLSLYREPSFGHGRLRIIDETRAHWSWHRNNDTDAFVADDVWIESLSTSKECSMSSSFDHDEL